LIIAKNKSKAAVLTSFFIFLLFSFGHVVKFFENHFNSFYYFKYNFVDICYYSFLLLWIFIFILVSWLVIKSHKEFKQLNYYLNTLSIVLVLISIFNVGYFLLQHQDKENAELVETNQEINYDNPDIYYLVFDSYARQDVLEEFYNYDNSDFINYLEENNFYVANQSTSNYPQTLLSISSTLNMDYLQDFVAEPDDEHDYRYELMEAIKKNKNSDFLKKKGYKFVTLPAAWVGSYDGLPSDITIEQDLSSNDFENILLTTILGRQIKMLDQEKRNKFNFLVDKVSDIAYIDEPTFTYVHFLPPHPPFVFDDQGNAVSSKDGPSAHFWAELILEGDQATAEEFKRKYIDQLIYVNTNIKKIVNDILEKSDKPPVIILQADHGANSMVYVLNQNEDSIRERFGILNAYYLPGNNYDGFYESITPVNSFRLIFNKIFGEDFELLPDKNFHAPYDDLYQFTDVTEDLHNGVIKKTLVQPIAEFEKRVTKKPFGIYITPQSSPVQPEKFSGYHTGVDVEYSDVEDEVEVVAIADGIVLRSEWVSGYGGMTAIRHNIDGQDYIVIYGHLNPDNLLAKGQTVSSGDKIGALGKGYSNQTDGERKHLHLAVYSGNDINVKGYVSSQEELSQWIDPLQFLK